MSGNGSVRWQYCRIRKGKRSAALLEHGACRQNSYAITLNGLFTHLSGQ